MMKTLAMAVALLAICAFGTAHADMTSTTYYNFPTTLTAPTWSGDFVVNQFNPSLGTLESVTLTLTETIGGTSTITNNNSTVLPVPYKWDVGDTITLTDAALSQFSLTVDSPTFSATVNSHLTSSSQTITGSGGLSPISDSVSPYYGTGQLDLLVSAAAFQGTVTSGANGSVNIAGTSDATLEVTYDYLPTPLPAGLLLFAPGLAGLVIGKKRLSK